MNERDSSLIQKGLSQKCSDVRMETCAVDSVLDELTDPSPVSRPVSFLCQQTLLRTSLLALLLLPLSLSCNSTQPLSQLRDDYMAVVQTDLSNAVSVTLFLLLLFLFIL